MNLDFVNNILNGLKESNFVQNFMKELSDYLENNSKNNFEINNDEIQIIEDILCKNKVTTANERAIKWKLDDVVLEYAQQNFSNDAMYFVKDSKKTYWLNNEKHYNNDVYCVLKVEKSEIEEIEISKKDMPKDISVNDVFKIKNDKYIRDDIAKKELKKEITNMAKEIIDKQNTKLDTYRKEGHLYMVSEEIGNNRFLWDLTDASKIEFEEINIPNELSEKAIEGAVLKFTNGKYEFYSNDGFERIEKLDE